jgi:hypothetical protein
MEAYLEPPQNSEEVDLAPDAAATWPLHSHLACYCHGEALLEVMAPNRQRISLFPVVREYDDDDDVTNDDESWTMEKQRREEPRRVSSCMWY